ncbi:hypothetical protein HDU97_009059 [Phlyctochytrium planicorne]|nr:hypothetical protein HDU97_009059 [Phlyctochytrium planicorne]
MHLFRCSCDACRSKEPSSSPRSSPSATLPSTSSSHPSTSTAAPPSPSASTHSLSSSTWTPSLPSMHASSLSSKKRWLSARRSKSKPCTTSTSSHSPPSSLTSTPQTSQSSTASKTSASTSSSTTSKPLTTSSTSTSSTFKRSSSLPFTTPIIVLLAVLFFLLYPSKAHAQTTSSAAPRPTSTSPTRFPEIRLAFPLQPFIFHACGQCGAKSCPTFTQNDCPNNRATTAHFRASGTGAEIQYSVEGTASVVVLDKLRLDFFLLDPRTKKRILLTNGPVTLERSGKRVFNIPSGIKPGTRYELIRSLTSIDNQSDPAVAYEIVFDGPDVIWPPIFPWPTLPGNGTGDPQPDPSGSSSSGGGGGGIGQTAIIAIVASVVAIVVISLVAMFVIRRMHRKYVTSVQERARLEGGSTTPFGEESALNKPGRAARGLTVRTERGASISSAGSEPIATGSIERSHGRGGIKSASYVDGKTLKWDAIVQYTDPASASPTTNIAPSEGLSVHHPRHGSAPRPIRRGSDVSQRSAAMHRISMDQASQSSQQGWVSAAYAVSSKRRYLGDGGSVHSGDERRRSPSITSRHSSHVIVPIHASGSIGGNGGLTDAVFSDMTSDVSDDGVEVLNVKTVAVAAAASGPYRRTSTSPAPHLSIGDSRGRQGREMQLQIPISPVSGTMAPPSPTVSIGSGGGPTRAQQLLASRRSASLDRSTLEGSLGRSSERRQRSASRGRNAGPPPAPSAYSSPKAYRVDLPPGDVVVPGHGVVAVASGADEDDSSDDDDDAWRMEGVDEQELAEVRAAAERKKKEKL